MSRWIPSAGLYNEIRDLLARAAGLASSGDLSVNSTPGGRTVGRTKEPDFDAKLISGSGTAGYTFRRQVRTSSGTWADLKTTNEPAAKAYEFNRASVPLNKVVRLRDVGLGNEYRFPWIRAGVPGSLNVQARGCNSLAIPDAKVELLDASTGSVLDMKTTPSTGNISFSSPFGTYQVRLTHPFLAAPYIQAVNFTTNFQTVLVNPTSGKMCCPSLWYPQPSVLVCTSKYGTVQLAGNPTTKQWEGPLIVPNSPTFYLTKGTQPCSGDGEKPAMSDGEMHTGTMGFYFQVTCSNDFSTGSRLKIWVPSCSTYPSYTAFDGTMENFVNRPLDTQATGVGSDPYGNYRFTTNSFVQKPYSLLLTVSSTNIYPYGYMVGDTITITEP